MTDCYPISTHEQVSIIFRGQGNVTAKERAEYHPDVAVFFQKNAWCDRVVAKEWADKVRAGPLNSVF